MAFLRVATAVALGKPRNSWRERGGWMGGMMLTTLLNGCYRFKGFVYESARFAESGYKAVEVQVRARSGSRPYCSGCGTGCVLAGAAVLFHSRRQVQWEGMRRGGGAVIVGRRQHTLTNAYMQFLANAANPLRRSSAPLLSVHIRTAGRLPGRSGQFAMKSPFSHKVTGWTIARNFAVVPAETRA
jgi:hypothetical protein